MNIDQIKDIIKKSDQLSENIDSEKTPYKSKYEAIELLKELKNQIIKENNEIFYNYLIEIDCKLGELYFQTDEITLSIKIFNETLKSIEESSIEHPIELIQINQTLSIISINNNDFKIGEEKLKLCENLINQELTKNGNSNQDQIEKLKSFQLQNHFYFAQLYTLTKESELSAKYIELTLNGQLKKEKFDKIEWCKNSLLLGDYYLKIYNFDYAKQCFLASLFVYKKIQDQEFTDSEQKNETMAMINLFIGKFFLEFLHVFRDIEYLNHAHKDYFDSRFNGDDDDFIGNDQQDNIKSKLLNEKEKQEQLFKENQIKKHELIDSITFNKKSLWLDNSNSLFKDSINNEQYQNISSNLSMSIDLQVVKDQSSARDIFLKSQHYFNKAKKYYQLDGFVSQHIQILFDLIDLFDYLNQFENLANRKIAINKKRIDLIEPLIKELNPTYFLAQLRKIFFKLSEIYNECSKIYQLVDCGGNLREIQNYNDCLFKSIQYYNLFIASYNNNQINSEQEKNQSILEDFDVYINALLGLAMCHKKVKGVNKLVNEHLEKSLGIFKSIVQLFEKDFITDEIKQKYNNELSLSKQMVTLLIEKNKFIQSKIPNNTKWYEKNNI